MEVGDENTWFTECLRDACCRIRFCKEENIKKESEAFIPNLTLDVGLRLPVR